MRSLHPSPHPLPGHLVMTVTPPTPPVTGQTRSLVLTIDRALLGFSRRWLFFLTLLCGIYVGLPFLAPVLMHFGLTGPAQAIYTLYFGLCHQLGFRSWYLFGAQAAYPRDIFQAWSGIDPNIAIQANLWAAKNFVGNEVMGWKVAYCQRDVGIYAMITLFGLFYALPQVRARLKSPPVWLYILIGIVPIGLDGFSQLFSGAPWNQFPIFSWLPNRESTPELRTLTGALFGLANAWLAYPYLEDSMREMRRELEAKLGLKPTA